MPLKQRPIKRISPCHSTLEKNSYPTSQYKCIPLFLPVFRFLNPIAEVIKIFSRMELSLGKTPHRLAT
jgi:hypothetical protein